jgi:hypothetical protein
LLAPPAGSFELIYEAARRRRRRKLTGVTSVITVAAVAAGVVLTTHTSSGTHGDSRLNPVAPSTSSATPTPGPRALTYAQRLPRYLPPGVTLTSQGAGNDPRGPLRGTTYWAHYDIAGYANSHDNFGRGMSLAMFDAAASSCGSPSVGRITRSTPSPPTASSAEVCAGPDWSFPFAYIAPNVRQQIHGRQAHVLAAANGLGPYIIEWHEGTIHYVLWEERLNTPAGTSGVDMARLIKMAESVPVDAGASAAAAPVPALDATFDPSVLGDVVARGNRSYWTPSIGAENDPVGTSIAYDATPGHQGYVYIYLIDNPNARLSMSDFDLSDPLQATTVQGHPATVYARAPGDHTTTSGLLYRTSHYAVVLVGGSGITSDQLKAVADSLRVSRHY